MTPHRENDIQPFNNQLILQVECELSMGLICRESIKNKKLKGKYFEIFVLHKAKET